MDSDCGTVVCKQVSGSSEESQQLGHLKEEDDNSFSQDDDGILSHRGDYPGGGAAPTDDQSLEYNLHAQIKDALVKRQFLRQQRIKQRQHSL